MTEGFYKVLLLTGVVVLATMFGVFAIFSHTIMPGLKKTDDKTFVKSFQAIDKQIINPIFMLQFFAPLAILGLAAYYAHKHHLIEAKYIYIALVCYIVVFIITSAVNVPLNDGLKKVADTANADSLASAREQFNEPKWQLFNHIRTLLTLAATGFTSAAIWVSKLI